MNDARAVLATLRDVPGVQGSFLMTSAGVLSARDMPSVFPDEALTEAGPRLARLADAFADAGTLQVCVVRCGDFTLFVRATEAGALCVLAGDGVSMPALRMATNVAARRLTSAAPPPPPPPSPDPAPSRPAVQWRGSTMRR